MRKDYQELIESSGGQTAAAPAAQPAASKTQPAALAPQQ
jgi:hypothetical protein